MHMGCMKFKQRGREEQAEADGTEVTKLLKRTLEPIFNDHIFCIHLGRRTCQQAVGY